MHHTCKGYSFMLGGCMSVCGREVLFTYVPNGVCGDLTHVGLIPA